MNSLSTAQKVHYTLRFASSMCFIGHGAFGIITKKIWLNYFAVLGIGPVLGYQLMPWLGASDILIGITILFYPTSTALIWLMIWGALTALLRPLSGEPFAEAIERAGNYGAPLALLLLSGFKFRSRKDWLGAIVPNPAVSPAVFANTAITLRIVVFLLLAGHGWLNLIEKKGLIDQYSGLGFANTAMIAHLCGIFEIIAAVIVLIKPIRPILMVFLIWKMATELFYPHWELFEWIERGGSYGALLALWQLLPETSIKSQKTGLARQLGSLLLIISVSIFMYLGFQKTQAPATAELPPIDHDDLTQLQLLDKEKTGITFVVVNPIPGNETLRNRVITLPPIGNELRINYDQYVHKGHHGPLYIILPDAYAGPKETFILKSFPAYKAWYGSMLSNNFVLYASNSYR